MRFVAVGFFVLAAAQECLDDEQCPVGEGSRVAGSSFVQSVHRQTHRMGQSADALVEDDEIKEGVLDLEPTMRTRLDGNVLHVAVQKAGALSLLELQEFSPIPGVKLSSRSFKSKLNDIPVRAQISANGDVSGWFGFDNGFMELTLNQRTNATSQQRTRGTAVIHERGPEDDPLGTEGAADASTWDGDVWYPHCFPQDSKRWKMKIGVLVDQAAQEWTSNWRERITAIVQAASVVYERQMNIELELEPIGFYTGSCAGIDQRDEREHMKTQLADVIENWLIPGTVTTHLFTGCDENADGYVGWGRLSCIAGGGICGAVNNIRAPWGTFAHELGHNFNAPHSFEEGKYKTGGIMDYGNGKHEGSVQFNTEYRQCGICSELTRLRRKMGGAFVPADSDVVPAVEDLKGVPRGCTCKVPADVADDCVVGVGYGWCKTDKYFRDDCPISCNLGYKLGCSPVDGDPSCARAWWQPTNYICQTTTTTTTTTTPPLRYTTRAGCESKQSMPPQGRLVSEKLPFRCCKADGSRALAGHDLGLCNKDEEGDSLTWDEANNKCKSLVGDYQLCTSDQLENNVACMGGCRADNKRVWASTAWNQ